MERKQSQCLSGFTMLQKRDWLPRSDSHMVIEAVSNWAWSSKQGPVWDQTKVLRFLINWRLETSKAGGCMASVKCVLLLDCTRRAKTLSLFFQFMPVVSSLTTMHHPEEHDCIILITPLWALAGCCFILPEASPSSFWRPNLLASPHQATVQDLRHLGGLSLYVHLVINVLPVLRGLKWDSVFSYSLRSDEQREDQSSKYASLLDMLLFIKPRVFWEEKKKNLYKF